MKKLLRAAFLIAALAFAPTAFIGGVNVLTMPALAIEEAKTDVLEEVTLDTTEESESLTERLFNRIVKDPKILKFEKGPINSFEYGLIFQGTSDMRFSDQDTELKAKYPMIAEIWASTKFEGGKSEFKLSSQPFRDVDDFDKKFRATFKDFYYKRKLGKHHSVIIGNARAPVGVEGIVPTANTLFVKRSQITNAYSNQRVPGIRLQGDHGFVDYDLGGYLSTRDLQDFGEGAEFISWVNFKPFNKQEGSIFRNLKFGGGIDTGRRDGNNYNVAGLGASWDYKKVFADFECATADGSNGPSYSLKHTRGLYTTLGYNINKKWQILGRYDVFDPDKTKSNNLKTQYTAGINYYVIGQRLKFVLNYVLEQNQATPNNDKHAIYFMTQVQI